MARSKYRPNAGGLRSTDIVYCAGCGFSLPRHHALELHDDQGGVEYRHQRSIICERLKSAYSKSKDQYSPRRIQ